MSIFDKVKKLGDGVKAALLQPIIVNRVTYKITALLAEGPPHLFYICLL